MVCPYCNYENEGSKKFCGHCGKPLTLEKQNSISIKKVLTFIFPFLFFLNKRKEKKKEYDTSSIILNDEQAKKYIKFFKLLTVLCFILNAVFIFIPVFHDPNAIINMFNDANNYLGNSNSIVTNYSIISIFNVLLDGDYHMIAVVYSVIHVVLCLISALATAVYKKGNMALQRLTSVGTVFMFIFVGVLVAIGISTYGFPYPCIGTIVFPFLSSLLAGGLIDMIVLSSKDINGGNEV